MEIEISRHLVPFLFGGVFIAGFLFCILLQVPPPQTEETLGYENLFETPVEVDADYLIDNFPGSPLKAKGAKSLWTNQNYIEGLYNSFNVSDPKEVFKHLFFQLDDEVVVYPTENFYYFKFTALGKMFGGVFALHADNRDNGVIDFGYIERNDNPYVDEGTGINRIGGSHNFSEEDGVMVKKINNFKYSVIFEGRKVIFKLNDIGMNPPINLMLHSEEEYVGPVFDESGLVFSLIFNKEISHLYIILNEDSFVPEYFRELTNDIVIGERSEFAFYNDKQYNRKILIGVKGVNVLKNNWFDGPFDQMPDNYVYTGQIPNYSDYLIAAYPNLEGRIDKYGNYLDIEGVRIAVGPYYVYWSNDELSSLADYCNSQDFPSKSEFYNCITQQMFIVPDEIQSKLW